MDRVDWAAAELTGQELRLWLMQGDAQCAETVLSHHDDPAAALRAALVPSLAPDAVVHVIAVGWPGTAPVPVPCPPPPPAAPLAINPQITLHPLPGLMQDRPADLIGAPTTTRIAGHLARYPSHDGVLCLPGPTTVWAHLSAGEVVSLRSFVTGELLALLADHPDAGQAGFAEAVQQAMSRPAGLAGDLSSVRAQAAMGQLDATGASARMAGLLIGAELAAARPWWLGQSVTIVGIGPLAERYVEALAAQGAAPATADPARTLLDGFRAAYKTV